MVLFINGLDNGLHRLLMTALHKSSTPCRAVMHQGAIQTGSLFLILSTARCASPITLTLGLAWTAASLRTRTLPPALAPTPFSPVPTPRRTPCQINIWKHSSDDIPDQKPSMIPLCLNVKAQAPNSGCYGLNRVAPKKTCWSPYPQHLGM